MINKFVRSTNYQYEFDRSMCGLISSFGWYYEAVSKKFSERVDQRGVIMNAVRPLEAGQAAPDFTLRATEPESVSLADYRGQKHVVLAFYVLDFTGG